MLSDGGIGDLRKEALLLDWRDDELGRCVTAADAGWWCRKEKK